MIRQILLYLLPCLAFADLSLEEKVGQLLMVHFNGETVNQDAKTLVQELHVGGIIYYNWANGLRSFEQVQQLSKDLQNLSSIPPLLGQLQ